MYKKYNFFFCSIIFWIDQRRFGLEGFMPAIRSCAPGPGEADFRDGSLHIPSAPQPEKKYDFVNFMNLGNLVIFVIFMNFMIF